ncbi:hypothetical protein MMC11_003007 [Xylographa trunciseda]|nr:hypothetical protein [Xylographa trunciseda]
MLAVRSANSHDNFNEQIRMDPFVLSLMPVSRAEESIMPRDEAHGTIISSDAWSLYISHALSTWNARSYEFAAILFTASAFPDTLLASSIRGLCNTVAALCLSSWIGTQIDQSHSRLRTLVVTISTNRASVILACLGWYLLVENNSNVLILHFTATTEHQFSLWLFALVICLGIFEKLSGIGNMICMERDWIPIFASASNDGLQHSFGLTHLNAVMRRIDLLCKLMAPLIISMVILVSSTTTGVVLVGLMSIVSWGVEVYCAGRVWISCRRLREPKEEVHALSSTTGDGSLRSRITQGSPVLDFCRKQWSQFSDYFSTDVWIPSLSLALLHLSVLSYSATFVTFCLNRGFSLLIVTIARALGSIVEVSSTFIVPFGVSYLATSKRDRDRTEDHQGLLESVDQEGVKEHSVGLARSGLWGLLLQLVTLAPVVIAIWYLTQQNPSADNSDLLSRILALASPFTSRPLAAIVMFAFLSLSRLGLWVFDLTTQEITQTEVQHDRRSSFAGTEMAFVSLFELSQWVLAAIVSRPEQFHWLALGSFTAVLCSTCMYAWWVRRQRGHLTHWDRLGKGCYSAKA